MRRDIPNVLQQLHISYKIHEHPAVFTVREADTYTLPDACGKTKNLFLTNRAGDHYFLLIVPSHVRVDLKKVARFVNEKKLSFASPEKLFHYLELTPGSVSPFGLLNDVQHEVTVLVAKDLMEESLLGFHPNRNTATLIIRKGDFVTFLAWTGNTYLFLDV